LNKNIFLLFIVIIFLIILSLSIFIYFSNNLIISNDNIINNVSADITNPKFSINGKNQIISVTANEGNFLTKDKVMLEKNVIFQSEKFKIYSDNVTFNKKNYVASSEEKSKFVSKNASINSIGFDIIENGNIINFKGKTKLILK
jgi:hypothetical protein